MRNYHFSLKRYSFAQVVRIAASLAVSSGISRLVWSNGKRVHLIAYGPEGYQREAMPATDWAPYGYSRLFGHIPPASVPCSDICELTPTFEEAP